MELLSPIRARISTFKTLETRKFGAPFSVACCASGPAQDEEGPFVSSDWRAFRAALVARQRAPLSSAAGPPITIGDKWAHTIYEPERGCLLIATEKLDGVHIFERTVILLLSTGPVGPTGLILNRPSLMSIKEMRWSAVDASGPFSEKALFFGGPLEEGLFLVSPRGGGGGGVERSGVVEKVMEGVYYGTKESAGCAAEMVKRSVVEAEEFRFFHGYCAWEGEQLRDEIRAGYWTVAACSPAVIQQTSVGGVGLWGEILGLMGPKKVW
ncbi:uncharacterized protein LOC130989646 [Salvia miltiorrhiza]|uniref:uncharacterized protein LOC130989646 n=1 Tax=Salvia miltiorrhiza TaxID=226208 RepID=UPI0025AB7980|nr:uncharacterized protein LOC130989646 [Salvia miltiorrhiza]